jgi:hypothetical protein
VQSPIVSGLWSHYTQSLPECLELLLDLQNNFSESIVVYFYSDKWILMSVKFNFSKSVPIRPKGLLTLQISSHSSFSQCILYVFAFATGKSCKYCENRDCKTVEMSEMSSESSMSAGFLWRRRRKGLLPLILRSELAAEDFNLVYLHNLRQSKENKHKIIIRTNELIVKGFWFEYSNQAPAIFGMAARGEGRR